LAVQGGGNLVLGGSQHDIGLSQASWNLGGSGTSEEIHSMSAPEMAGASDNIHSLDSHPQLSAVPVSVTTDVSAGRYIYGVNINDSSAIVTAKTTATQPLLTLVDNNREASIEISASQQSASPDNRSSSIASRHGSTRLDRRDGRADSSHFPDMDDNQRSKSRCTLWCSMEGCPTPGKRFKTRKELQRHVRNVHFKAGQMQCPYCVKKLSRRDNLSRHIRTFHRKAASNLELETRN
jgi:uncharacterized C2H2 Zn-finger protein